jgi:hypothetical protein
VVTRGAPAGLSREEVPLQFVVQGDLEVEAALKEELNQRTVTTLHRGTNHSCPEPMGPQPEHRSSSRLPLQPSTPHSRRRNALTVFAGEADKHAYRGSHARLSI